MASANSTQGKRPAKPYSGFPLGWHPAGYWCKKIRGKLHYFGPRHGTWEEALEEYQRDRDDLHAGRKPRAVTDGVTVRYLCHSFLTDREHRMDSGELTQRSFSDYRKSCERIVSAFGASRLVADLRADDFLKLRSELSKGWTPTTLANEIQRVRVVFNYAWQAELIDKPIRFGPTFKRPSKRVMREHRQKKGKRLFDPADIRDLIDIASPQMRAMILLGINAGLGNSDCAKLEMRKHIDGHWLDYPRPKTLVDRRGYLWAETLEALRHVADNRKPPKNASYGGLLFVTKYGGPWYSEDLTDNPVTKEFRKLLDKLGIYRPGLGFYALRHSFETVAGESKDQIAVDRMMGHERNDMASVYRESISDERLQAVADHVRVWLFGEVA